MKLTLTYEKNYYHLWTWYSYNRLRDYLFFCLSNTFNIHGMSLVSLAVTTSEMYLKFWIISDIFQLKVETMKDVMIEKKLCL